MLVIIFRILLTNLCLLSFKLTAELATIAEERAEHIGVEPYVLEESHPAWGVLEKIFQQRHPLQNASMLAKAGFKIVSARDTSMYVVAHPKLPGYLLKLYLSDEKNNAKRDISWALERCSNAKKLREFVAQKKLKHFTVPMKWIYLLPDQDWLWQMGIDNCGVLLVEDMQLVSQKESRWTWSHLSSSAVIDELYMILSYGYSSCHLPANMPFTKNGTFSCIDTEKPHKRPAYERVNKYLLPEMQTYWNHLVSKKKPSP